MKARLGVYGMSVVDHLKNTQAAAGVDLSCVILLPDPGEPEDCFLLIVTDKEMTQSEMKYRHCQCLEAMALTLAKMTDEKTVLNCVSRAFSMADGCMICDDAFDEIDRMQT